MEGIEVREVDLLACPEERKEKPKSTFPSSRLL
jgi:hypothetical protein